MGGRGAAGIYKKRKSHSHFYSGSNNEETKILLNILTFHNWINIFNSFHENESKKTSH